MKSIYKLFVVLGIIYLVTTNATAQVVQYSDDGTESFIDPQEKSANTERSCLCIKGFQLGIFNAEIPTNSVKEKWLYEQEILLATSISGINYFGMYNNPFGLPDDYNFSNIQRNYFKAVETNNLADQYYTKVDDYFAQIFNYDNIALQNSSINSKILDIRKRAGTVNPKYGDLKYNGEYLRDISNVDVDNMLNEQLGIRNAQRSAFLKYDQSRSRLERSVTEGWTSNYLTNQYINHYNGLDYEDAIRFMTRYMVGINEKDRGIPYLPFGNPHNIFVLDDHDYTSRIAINADLGPTMEGWTAREFTDSFDEDRVLYGLALTNLKSGVRDFMVRNNFGLKSIFEENKYIEGVLDRYDETLVSYMNNTPFDGTFSGSMVPNSGTAINLPTDLGVELAYKFSFNDTGVTNGIRGFSNALYTLFNLDENHKNLEGSYMSAFFEADGQLDLGFLSNEQLATLVDFSTIYPWEGTYYTDFFLEYEDNEINRILFANNIRFFEMLDRPYVIEGTRALLNGESFDFAFREMVYDLSNTLQLNDAQQDWLLQPENEERARQLSRLAIDENWSPIVKTYLQRIFNSITSGDLVTISPFVKYPKDKAEQYKRDYPELTEFLKNELPKIANNEKIINAIHGITDAPIETIKEALQWGKGPEIVIEQLKGEGDEEQYGVYRGAHVPELRNKLFLDIDLVNDIENLENSAIFREELSFLIAVTILHEYNHLGDAVFGDLFWEELHSEEPIDTNEAGAVFEIEIFGVTVWRSNVGVVMRNFGNW